MKRFKARQAYLLFILVMNIVLITGCGGGGDTASKTAATTPVTTPVTGAPSDTTAPTVTLTVPYDGARNFPTDTEVSATFSEEMNSSTINKTTFTLMRGDTDVLGSVTYSGKTAVFTPDYGRLLASSIYTATITTGAKDLAGNALASNYVWIFTTASPPAPTVPPGIIGHIIPGAVSTFGSLEGTAGATNTGVFTAINGGDFGSTAVATVNVTGFHDSAPSDFYTETLANIGAVSGKIYTCTVSSIGPTSGAINAASCLTATNGWAAAQTTFNSLSPAAMPGGIDPGAGQLGGLVLPAGIYQSASGGFLITGSDLTLDGGGDANATFVFQMASTLTVGAPGAPRTVHLINGAQSKNVFWYVGSSATINGAGGGTMEGNIFASSAISFSTVGVAAITTLNGRAVALNASITMVNTVINVPAP